MATSVWGTYIIWHKSTGVVARHASEEGREERTRAMPEATSDLILGAVIGEQRAPSHTLSLLPPSSFLLLRLIPLPSMKRRLHGLVAAAAATWVSLPCSASFSIPPSILKMAVTTTTPLISSRCVALRSKNNGEHFILCFTRTQEVGITGLWLDYPRRGLLLYRQRMDYIIC